MKKQIFILTIVLASVVELIAQRVEPITVQAIVVGSDTIPIIRLNEVEIYSFKIPKTRKAKKKLYPWARLAGIQLRKYDNLLSQAKNDKERRKIMKEAEKEINKKYGGSLKKLTFSQGKILIKLIDRETGNTSYSLVQVLRGNFTAFFYQAFARIWGYNLKVKYDPNGADKNIETIVRMIERGQI